MSNNTLALHYYGANESSRGEVPTFKNLVEILLEEGKLIPNAEAIKKIQEEEMQDSVTDENKTIEDGTE